jgi:hypothetical protein
MNIVDKYEKATIGLLNIDGWKLEWCGDENTFYDARGTTPKGLNCVIEMKFRNKYYETKMLEKAKYDKLMSLPDDTVKIYFVNDAKGNYMYWLNKLELPTLENSNCPKTTMWDRSKIKKEVYMLTEKQASIVNWYEETTHVNVWEEHFKKK